jgi:ABC-type branched-subunit amino acid transport system substrate-binding protein
MRLNSIGLNPFFSTKGKRQMAFMMLRLVTVISLIIWICPLALTLAAADPVLIALNYPESGPYAKQGLDQWRAAEMARIEINAAGGILGRPIEFRLYDSQSNVKATRANVRDAIENRGVQMVFGGSSSAVAIAASEICQEKGVVFFATLTYSTSTTGKDGHRHTFRECYDSWMAARALAAYMRKNFSGKKYFYITADYTWGWTTEASLRKFTGTEDTMVHKGVLTPFPSTDFSSALESARKEDPQVLVLVLFGQEMADAIRKAHAMGFKNSMQIVVPNLTLGMAERGTPEAMQGVIGALPWTWKVPYQFNYARGVKFVEAFRDRYNRYPSTSGASAYTILYEYKAAVERAGSFEAAAVIKALEGHAYQLLKDKQLWRDFDHQSVQTVYTVRCNPPEIVLKDKLHLDYFEIIDSIPGPEAAITWQQWAAARKAAGKPVHLEQLPGE